MNHVTLSGTLAELRKQGYTEDFNLQQNCLECRNGEFKVFSDEFMVDNYYRFEGASDPSDQAIVYAISSDVHDLKGVLVNAYGIYSEVVTDEMLKEYVTFFEKRAHKATPLLGYRRRTREIARIVKESHADLLILGSHGHKGITDIVWGETINQVRHLINIPVFIAK